MQVGRVSLLARYPVKSLGGEHLVEAGFNRRGVVGDRSWAAYTADGSIGSGKTTQRFRRVEGLLDLTARLEGARRPVVRFPDGSEHPADEPLTSSRLSAALGQPLTLRPESSESHHDDCPVHVVTTAGLRRLEQILGEPVDVRRFRPNVVLDVEAVGFVEDGWRGRELALGSEVVLRLGEGMPRCAMVGLPQEDLPRDARILKTLGHVHDVEFGLMAEVVRGGTVRDGDVATLI